MKKEWAFKHLTGYRRGPSPRVSHFYTNAHQPEKLQTTSEEDRKVNDHIPLFQKLPGGQSPHIGNSHVEKLSSNAVLIKSSSNPSPSDDNYSTIKLKLASWRQKKKKVKKTGGALDLNGVGHGRLALMRESEQAVSRLC